MTVLTQVEETSLFTQTNKDVSSFNELYNDYFPRVYNYVQYRVADFHAAEDLTSQIFEKLCSSFKYYKSEKAPFSAWLFSIARNTITDYYRSQKRIYCISAEISEDLIDSRPDPVDIVSFTETRQHLLVALAALNQREQDIIALKFWSGLSNRDIAKLIGISESNTGVILFRAMRRLRLILEGQGMNIYG